MVCISGGGGRWFEVDVVSQIDASKSISILGSNLSLPHQIKHTSTITTKPNKSKTFINPCLFLLRYISVPVDY